MKGWFFFAPPKVRAGLGNMDLSDQSSVGCEDVNSVENVARPSCGRPDVAVCIAADSVGIPRSQVREQAAVLHARVVLDVLHANRMRIVRMLRLSGIDHAGFLLVAREAESVWLIEVADDDCCFGVLRLRR